MLKKLLSAALAAAMLASVAVIPAHAAKFSDENKRKNAYDICLNTDSNFVQLIGNGYERTVFSTTCFHLIMTIQIHLQWLRVNRAISIQKTERNSRAHPNPPSICFITDGRAA